MASSTMATSPPSRLSRALPAAIFLVLGILAFLLMDIPSLIADFPAPSATGFIHIPDTDIKVAILERFHYLEPVDAVFRDITIAFAPSAFGFDGVSRWQMANFYGDIGVLYLVWLGESLRAGNASWFVRFPAILTTIIQIAGGGVFVPLYYFCHIVLCPPVQSQSPAQRRMAVDKLLLLQPLLLLFHYGAAGAMMFDPSLDGRHYWSWFWQLFYLRISVAYYSLLALKQLVPFPKLGTNTSYRSKVLLVFTPLIVFSAGLWTYTMFNCPYPLTVTFFPQPLLEGTWTERMRRILQIDQLFIGGASLVWMMWLAVDMKKSGLISGRELFGFGVATVVFVVLVGPGATLGILWVWRETILSANTEEEDEKKKIV